MKTLTYCIAMMLITSLTFAQSNQDREAILDFCGCYEVSFQFAETFSPDPNYAFKDNYYSSGLELILPVAAEDNFISLQHLLIVGRGDKQSVIKHWREDWQFEDRSLYAFAGGDTWQYQPLPEDKVEGQWTQKVFEVSDAPRYAASASWIHADGRRYWESTSDAPLPRREYTKRDDYNVLQRTNHHEITDEGHFHEQDNIKISRRPGRERIRAHEKGMNVYTKVADERCELAQTWWQENQHFWADVRTVWQEVFDRQEPILLQHKVDDMPMFMHLFPLGEEMSDAENYDSLQAQAQIREIIEKYLEEPVRMASEEE